MTKQVGRRRASAKEPIAGKFRRDPVFYVEEALGDDPWEKQREILEAVRDCPRVAVRSAHGVGKSFIAARAALWFGGCFADSIVATTAPTFRQVRRVMWSEIRSAYAKSRVGLGGKLLETELRLDDKWFLIGLSARDPDAFQGLHARHVLVVIDEASGVPREIWDAIDGMLSGDHCRLLSIGNPTDPTSAFFDEFKNPATRKITISAFDSPNVSVEFAARYGVEKRASTDAPVPGLTSEAWIEEKHRRWGPTSPLYAARVLGQFPEQGTDSLIPIAWIERARHKWEDIADPGPEEGAAERARALLEEAERGPSELGLDVARFGDDETVCYHRKGKVARLVFAVNGASTMETSGKAIVARRETKAEAIKVDDIGLGGGVTDRLRELEEPVVPVNVGERARDNEKFVNKRAEHAWALRERFEAGDVILVESADREDDEELDAELAAAKYKMNSRGQIQLEEKSEVKKRLRRSPDRADSLTLAFAAEELKDEVVTSAKPVSFTREAPHGFEVVG